MEYSQGTAEMPSFLHVRRRDVRKFGEWVFVWEIKIYEQHRKKIYLTFFVKKVLTNAVRFAIIQAHQNKRVTQRRSSKNKRAF